MLRRRSIRTRIIVLVLVPVIALIGLYAVALSLTLSSYLSLVQAGNVKNAITNPATNVQFQLSTERGLALEYLADPSHPRLLDLLAEEPETDAAINAFTTTAAQAHSDASPGERRAIQTWETDLATLRSLRATVVNIGLSRAAAASSYSDLIAGADYVLTQAVLPVLGTSALIQANDVLTMEESLQAVAEERDLFTADLTTHSYPAADARLVNQLMVQHRELWNQATSSLDRQYLKFFTTDIPATAATGLGSFENRILASPRSAMRISLDGWTSTNNAYATGFRKALRSASAAIRQSGYSQVRGLLLRLILIGGLGLCAIVAAIAIAIILSRALLQQLDDLRLSALELSSVRLPVVLARLRSGEEVNIAGETPQLDPGENEIGQLGRAFNLAAQTAVAAAADEAEIRRGVNDVFRNLARRNQSLLTRQLELLDAMERRVDDPEELADLFRVDHLTTRMRRHAEGLLIVAGGSSGRVWRDPVPIVDVMRAAVAEIEDYTRIRVTSRSNSSVAGHAVADIIHMLAELVENATTFSPANTPVRIESDNVAKGLIVEIEDRGLGMSEAQLDEINAKLNDPPLLDLSGSEQLGLFIAGQLARRHEVKITMRGSAYGGVVAVVLIPSALVIGPGYAEPLSLVELRELGGRPVPQLPAPAATSEQDAAVGSPPEAEPEHAGKPGYLVDLEIAATSATTTATQVGAGPSSAVPDADRLDDLITAGAAADLTIPPAVSSDLASAGSAYLDLVDGGSAAAEAGGTATAADVGSADPEGDSAPVGLKGAGAWLVEAGSAEPATDARPPVTAADSSSAPLAAGLAPESPKLILEPSAIFPSSSRDTAAEAGEADSWPVPGASSPQADGIGPVDHSFGPIDAPLGSWDSTGRSEQSVGWPESAPAPGPAGGSVGWPGESAASADWLSLASSASRDPGGPPGDAIGLSRQAAPDAGGDSAPDDGAVLPHRGDPSQRRPFGMGNGSPGEARATGTVPLLPRRQARTQAGGALRAQDNWQSLDDTDTFAALADDRPGAAGLTTRESEPTTSGPVAGEPVAGEPVAVEPVAGEPITGEIDGLPIRVRQASLAPQLRDQMATEPGALVADPQPSAEEAIPTGEPSPEAARSFMSALQRGWERGRSMAEQITDEPEDEQT